jgi:hypothetical protein
MEEKVKNPYITKEQVNEAFRNIYLEENYSFLEEDLMKLADGFIMAAMPEIRKVELAMCVDFVKSLNPDVAAALHKKRSKL